MKKYATQLNDYTTRLKSIQKALNAMLEEE